MDVLVCLASYQGGVVSKETLVEDVWDGRPITDEVITRCISLLRNRLGDDPKDPVFIETLHRRGYRLIPEVRPLDAENTGERAEVQDASRRSTLWLGLALPALALVALAYFLLYERPEIEPVDSVAVLPFQNMSTAPDQYLCDGLTEELIHTLAQIPGLKVAARTSSFEFRDRGGDIRDIAERLGVNAVIEGSVRRDGDRVRVTAQLIDARSGYHLWSDAFDDPVDDIFRLQERVAAAVESAIRGKDAEATPGRTRPSDFETYDHFLRGRFALNRRTADSLRQAISLFEAAIERDPGYGPAYLQLAYSHLLLPGYAGEPEEQSYQRALRTVESGVEADPSIEAGADAVRGFVLMKRGEWLASKAAFERAVQADPPDADTHQWFSQLLSTLGRMDLSLAQARIAKEIDPLSPVANGRLAVAHLWADNDAAARRYFDIARELRLETAVNLEAYTLLLLREGRYEQVGEIFSNLQRRYGLDDGWVGPVIGALSGEKSREEAIAAVSRAVQEGALSARVEFIVWGLLDEADRAMALARRLIDDPDLFEVQLLHIRELAALRRHPAYPDLVDALGLSDYWRVAGCRLEGARLLCANAAKITTTNPPEST